MKTTIYKATINDAATIARIGAQTMIESHGRSCPKADMDAYVAQKFTLDAVRADLGVPENIYYIIEAEGEAAGYSKIVFDAPHEHVKQAKATKLDRLYTLQALHGNGLGQQLFNWNVQLSQNAQQSGMWLYTWVGNDRAIAFYKKVGFTIVGAADFKISDRHSNPNHIMWRPHLAKPTL